MDSWNVDAYDAFHHGWALLTAGNSDHFNTMTISWGGLGCLWSRSVATVYVRPSRYTYEFMERSEYFTVSFYPSEFKPALAMLGRESGRDIDKVAASGLTPVAVGPGVSFAQAKVTLLCKKLYAQDLDIRQIPEDVVKGHYPDSEDVHRMYIGQVMEVVENS